MNLNIGWLRHFACHFFNFPVLVIVESKQFSRAVEDYASIFSVGYAVISCYTVFWDYLLRQTFVHIIIISTDIFNLQVYVKAYKMDVD